MARVQEEEEEAGASGQCGLPRYAVGSEVEVKMTDRGFHGAYYEAIVTAILPDSASYEVVYSTLVEDGGGGPLRETAAPDNVRPRPPPTPLRGSPRCELNMFDMVEAYHNEGWWSGVVSGAWPASKTAGEPRYAVSFPTVPEVVEVQASLVRLRRTFAHGRWIDMHEVVTRFGLYDEGSNVEVIWDEGKLGTTWMPATIVKMVGSTNYVVRHGNSKGSILVLHSSYIRPKPMFDRIKLDYQLEPSAAVEVYRDGGTWSPGVILNVGNCRSSKYAVRVEGHNNGDEEDYTLVSSNLLRPSCKWDGQEWRLCSAKKHAKKRKYTVSIENSFISPVFSTPGRDNDQNSSVPNKRVRKANVRNEEPYMKHSLYPSQVTAGLSSKHDIDIKAPSDKRTMVMEKLYSENGAEGRECIRASSTLPKLTCTQGDGKWRNCLTKTVASTRGYDESLDVDEVEISNNSGYGDVIEIRDNSSSIPNKRKKRRENPSEEELHSRHIVHRNQESSPTSNLPVAENPLSNQNLLPAVTKHPEVQPFNDVLRTSVVLVESSRAPSYKDGVQLTTQAGYPVRLPGMIETKEPSLSDHVNSEAELMARDDSTARDKNQEVCQEVTKVKSWVADKCKEVADTSLITSKNSKRSIVDRSPGKANPIRQPSRDSEVPISGKIEPTSSAQQGVKACMQVVTNSICVQREMNNGIVGISPKEEAHCNLEILIDSKKIANASCSEFIPLSQHMSGQCPMPISRASGPSSFVHPVMTMDLSTFMPAPSCDILPPELVTCSLVLRPHDKMEVFTRLPQNPHFRKLLQDCHSEFREGKSLGLMISFANLAVSIQNMRIQDDDQLFQGKLSSLSELEDNGFDVGALKIRLANLLFLKNQQMDLKDKARSLEQDLLEKEMANTVVEQQLTVLDIGIKELERMLLHAHKEKALLVAQKTTCSYEISKLQVDAHQVEESFISIEGDFNRNAAMPW